MHWNRSECNYPPFSPVQWELLTGILLGDGDIHGKGDPNAHFRVRMTNRRFLEFVDRELGFLSKGVFLARTARTQFETAARNQREGREGFETVVEENYHDLNGLRTCSHPALDELRDWYQSGDKRYPSNLELTPTVVKAWYVCDGWLAKEAGNRSRVMVKATNEAHRPDYLVGLFADTGFEVGFSRNAIQVPADETERLLDWMGDPSPGFEYKWEL